jgi:hypothetical protein
VSARYDYLTFELARGRPAWEEFTAALRGKGTSALSATGADLVAAFAPQLGFASNEAVLLIRGAAEILPSEIVSAPGVISFVRDRLSPTVRPRDGQRLKSGGIYVHRWFTIDGERAEEFIDLSNRAWSGFEGSYDTEIFGLFLSEMNETDQMAHARRLLLLTWYKNHAVWEASREQARDAKSLFAQRHLLTRTTIGRSSVLVA